MVTTQEKAKLEEVHELEDLHGALQYSMRDANEISDDRDKSDVIKCALEIVGMEFFDDTIAKDDHNEEPSQGIVVVNYCF